MFYLDLNNPSTQRAAAKAARVNPEVYVIEFGLYSVSGSSGNCYEVKCYKNDYGERVIECNCPTAEGNACYHGAAAAREHIRLAKEQLEKATTININSRID